MRPAHPHGRPRRSIGVGIVAGGCPPDSQCFGDDGAQGRDRTADTVIFSHVLYQLSYLGMPFAAGRPFAAERPLAVVLLPVHPGQVLLGGWRAGDAIGPVQPLQEVAILAPARAERRVVVVAGLAAIGTALGFGFKLSRHGRRTW